MPKEKKCGDFEVIRQGEEKILSIDYEKCLIAPSVEDNPICMAKTIEAITQAGDITKIVFHQKKDYEYNYEQTKMLVQIAKLYNSFLKKQKLLKIENLGIDIENYTKYFAVKYVKLQEIIFKLLKSDPLGAYVELRRELRREKTIYEGTVDEEWRGYISKYVSMLEFLVNELDKTDLIRIVKAQLPGFKVGDRSIYKEVFSPSIKPNFMFTKLMSQYPIEGDEIDTYSIGTTDITIFKFPNSVKYLYHMIPMEFKLSEEKYELLEQAKNIMEEHKPKKAEFTDPEHAREVFYSVGKDLIEELAGYKGYEFPQKEIKDLASILVRYTIGFGLIEVLLSDEKIQDISINAPLGQTPMFIVHGKYGDCYTNIVPTRAEAESWASKLRMISGRPLDEANQILDTEIIIPKVASTRVAAITEPLNPYGLAFAFRRHRDRPWTLPLFIKYKMINPLAGGLLSFLVDGTRSMLIAGTRSSGKTSLLGSLLVEIMRRYRVITIEDTLELPTISLRKLGYNIQPLKVASALAKAGSEISATDGIRSTLRLGDSALIVGEVRSTEAISLYEAMRVGAAANVVAGTIHAESPYGVFDRVVNDIGVPKTSFKATDIIAVANPIKSASGISKQRRVTSITEVRKRWEKDPLLENGFVDLMKYDIKTDQLQPTSDLINGDSEILKIVAGNIKELAGSWDAVWENINLRADIKKTIVDLANKTKNWELLEAPFTIKCNDSFHNVTEKIREESGLDSKRILFEWNDWLKKELKKKNIK